MASTSKMKSVVGDEALEDEELERFNDFTLASSWERFISDIEAVCRQWMADGPKNLLEKGAIGLGSSKNLYKVKSELKYAMKSYITEYFFETNNNGKMADWNDTLHDVQLCFGVKDFLVIAPQSASGVILDTPESSKLLSAVAIALSNCSSMWPAFVPVHDPSRKAYIGIQNMGTVFTRRFEADHISSQVPVKLMHLEGLYELFVSKFAYSTMDPSAHAFQVRFKLKLTYETLAHDDDDSTQQIEDEVSESVESPLAENHTRSQWDDDCPWSEWYSAEDPVKGFELIAIWTEAIVESSLEMAELENASPHDAENWIISPRVSRTVGSNIGFASQLCLLVDALDMSFEAQFLEDFVSEKSSTDALKSSMVIPPPTVVDRVLKELFQEGVKLPDLGKAENKNSRIIKGAPLGSLFTEFCLNVLWIGNCNIRAIALLWIEFVREVRWCWEESQPLPRMPDSGSIDLSTCLINQKLQMLAICIDKKQQASEEFLDCISSADTASAHMEEDDQFTVESSNVWQPVDNSDNNCESSSTRSNLHDHERSPPKIEAKDVSSSAGPKSSDVVRRGSAGEVGSVMLLKLRQSLHAPYTQEALLMTEDMHEERLRAVHALGDSFNFSAQLEKEVLYSDMSAFKAANPDAVFEDFIRWHSPGDWESDEPKEVGSSSGLPSVGPKVAWPPRGRLSQRMSEHGNMWRKIWNDAPSLPVSEQKPLLDPNREGEKILHYLETIRPHQLLEQMVCTSFRAAADTINQTNYGRLKPMETRMDQLYLTMASTLRRLQANLVSAGSETIEDLRRLIVIFGRVEKLMTVAASLHRKFLQAPSLAETIFIDYYKFHSKKMGTSRTGEDDEMEFDMKLQLRSHERQVISNMFTPPSANQSWRKVLSMGNLLNGHEPTVREVMFSKRDRSSGNHYAARTPRDYREEEIETYRMYICGTSNDLRVALSVASYD
ncbi:rab3 GTPase-activating protein catalytic subunit isoform X2 [Punica granatum]|uniref:Rab3 GTPase-activating protein catalytic subunit n=1 Tax=Punica granatum TaxID=22663 RepID=A0A6P8D1U5_PUNGR|nr:rab3 GTPase-activating protein catalytic subunit isoform X2 [Punica granatum]